jgi:DNA (cytosine-5)-methyltransferase 1
MIRRKINRLKTGSPARVLDLFSGCGGLSLGFQSAGFEITAAIEFDKYAAQSHGINFHGGDVRHCFARDITATSPNALCRDLSLGKPKLAFDVIVGGPPCQAFARVGRSKLREVADNPEAFRHDPRSRLYIDYLNYVRACQPLAVVMENVPDMLNHGGHNLAGEVAEVLDNMGYECGYTILNAAFYGVPQMRERMFLIALHRELNAQVVFPEPDHWISLPSGYDGSRAVALKLLNSHPSCRGDSYYHPAPTPAPSLPGAITTKQAIGDLPAIDARGLLAKGLLKRGTRRFDIPVQYDGDVTASDYARRIRTWAGHEGEKYLYDHVIRYLPRDYNLFARMNPGDQYPQAIEHAERMFNERLEQIPAGQRPQKDSSAWNELRQSIVPPYDPGKFPNKWRKMEADTPARTLLAHLGKDSYSHIHYDHDQARTISVREAARLQSFPDGFKFCGTMNPAFRQIGNAVPPLMARAVAQSVLKQINTAVLVKADRFIAVGE